MSNEPHVIRHEKVVELLVGLGVDPNMDTLSSVLVEPGVVTVTRLREVRSGVGYIVGQEPNERPATEIVTIRVER